jgi:hypothetical protein
MIAALAQQDTPWLVPDERFYRRMHCPECGMRRIATSSSGKMKRHPQAGVPYVNGQVAEWCKGPPPERRIRADHSISVAKRPAKMGRTQYRFECNCGTRGLWVLSDNRAFRLGVAHKLESAKGSG